MPVPGAMSSPPSLSSEKIVAIKPKAVRLVPMTNYDALEAVASKPSSGTSCVEGNRQVQAPPVFEQTNLDFINLSTSGGQQSSFSLSQIYEPPNFASRETGLDTKAQQQSSSGDGYNWRKYGQKQVKGSQYPRSYYKCTYPNCQMKKKLERTFNGGIAEIVYEGEHNHPKPHTTKRMPSASQGQHAASDEHERDHNAPLSCPSEGNVSARRMDNSFSFSTADLSGFATDLTQRYPMHDHLIATNFESTATPIRSSDDQACNEGIIMANVESNRIECKRRKIDGQISEAVCHSATQISAELDISGDGFYRRKYGQKIVKGNTHTRSYYESSRPRYVERTPDNSGSFVTTYERKHHHHVPTPK